MNPSARSFGSLVLLLVLGSLLAGCASRIPFTHELRHQHRLSDEEIKQLQFYVSHTVTLRSEVDMRGRRITDGHKLVLTSGKWVEEVVIEDETPGVAVAVGPESIAISFEHGSALEFVLHGTEVVPRPAPPRRGRFAEPPPEPFPGNWDHEGEPVATGSPWGNYWLAVEGDTGLVRFRGRAYQALDESVQAHLLIDADELEEVVESRTVLGGRTL